MNPTANKEAGFFAQDPAPLFALWFSAPPRFLSGLRVFGCPWGGQNHFPMAALDYVRRTDPRPSLDLTSAPTSAQIVALRDRAYAEDPHCTRVLWVAPTGLVHLSPLAEEQSPDEWAAPQPSGQVRFYVAEAQYWDHAQRPEWVELVVHWYAAHLVWRLVAWWNAGAQGRVSLLEPAHRTLGVPDSAAEASPE